MRKASPTTRVTVALSDLQKICKICKNLQKSANPPNGLQSKLAAARMKRVIKNVNGSTARGSRDKKETSLAAIPTASSVAASCLKNASLFATWRFAGGLALFADFVSTKKRQGNCESG